MPPLNGQGKWVPMRAQDLPETTKKVPSHSRRQFKSHSLSTHKDHKDVFWDVSVTWLKREVDSRRKFSWNKTMTNGKLKNWENTEN